MKRFKSLSPVDLLKVPFKGDGWFEFSTAERVEVRRAGLTP